MKKSLNNVFRGKRLVTGDENEITQHEMLLEEKDDKVIVKQRGTDGSIQQVSGGGNDSANSILYYTKYSGWTCVEQSPLSSLEDLVSDYFPTVSTVANQPAILEYQLKEVDIRAMGKWEYTGTGISFYREETHKATGHLTINASDIKDITAVNVETGHPSIVSLIKYTSGTAGFPYKISITNLPSLQMQNIATSSNREDCAIYDPAANILFYYIYISSLHIEIFPKSLAKSLRIFGQGEALLYIPDGAESTSCNEFSTI